MLPSSKFSGLEIVSFLPIKPELRQPYINEFKNFLTTLPANSYHLEQDEPDDIYIVSTGGRKVPIDQQIRNKVREIWQEATKAGYKINAFYRKNWGNQLIEPNEEETVHKRITKMREKRFRYSQ